MRPICAEGPVGGHGYDLAVATAGSLMASDETRLWDLAGAAWAPLGAEISKVRHALSARSPGGQVDGLAVLTGVGEAFAASLTAQCRELADAELAALDRVTERKLYDIDSAVLQTVTGGSQDGFLYARGFIVAMGRRF